MEVTRSRGSPRGHLRVNTNTGFGIHQLAPALPEFLARYPDIDVELSITDRVVDLVADHADMTIRAGPYHRHICDSTEDRGLQPRDLSVRSASP